jgi:hypothetical protein
MASQKIFTAERSLLCGAVHAQINSSTLDHYLPPAAPSPGFEISLRHQDFDASFFDNPSACQVDGILGPDLKGLPSGGGDLHIAPLCHGAQPNPS